MATPLTFNYSVLPTGTSLPDSMYSGYYAVSNSLALDHQTGFGRVFIHGNSKIVVKRGAKDVSKQFAVFRRKRVWLRPLDPTPAGGDPMGGPTGPYLQGRSTFETDSEERPGDQWSDTVGWNILSRITGCERSLHEFIVGAVDPVTHIVSDDSGGIYLFVIIDLSPTSYRIRMSAALKLSKTDWLAARDPDGVAAPIPLTDPYKTEDDATPSIAWDSGWQSWGTYNSQLPVEVP